MFFEGHRGQSYGCTHSKSLRKVSLSLASGSMTNRNSRIKFSHPLQWSWHALQLYSYGPIFVMYIFLRQKGNMGLTWTKNVCQLFWGTILGFLK